MREGIFVVDPDVPVFTVILVLSTADPQQAVAFSHNEGCLCPCVQEAFQVAT